MTSAATASKPDDLTIPCACGCGRLVRQFDRSRHKRSYIRGHNIRHLHMKHSKAKAPRDYSQPSPDRLWALAQLGGKCVCCGFSDVRALQIDHVNGDGKKERRERRIASLTRLALEDKAAGGHRYQLLCANCNWIKRWERDESPRHRAHDEVSSTKRDGTTTTVCDGSLKTPCACGCGNVVPQFDDNGRQRFYVRGHNVRHMIKLGMALAAPRVVL